MRVWNYGEALDVVVNEFDLKNETFISDDEMVGFFNKGIQQAASDIYKLGVEDEYFQNEALIPLVQGTSAYNMPADIYAHKIRSLIYHNGTELYEIFRLRRQRKFVKEQKILQFAQDARYQYRIKNSDVVIGPQIILVPPARETLANVVTAYYIREASFIPLVSAGSLAASRATKIDVPECQNFLFAYVKWCVAKKIPHPNLEDYKEDEEAERMAFINTLTGETDDDNTEVVPDMTHYQESS